MSRPGARPAPYHRTRDKRIKRLCLKCDKEFIANGRFNRICPKCSDVFRYWDGVYSGNTQGGIYI